MRQFLAKLFAKVNPDATARSVVLWSLGGAVVGFLVSALAEHNVLKSFPEPRDGSIWMKMIGTGMGAIAGAALNWQIDLD